MVKLEDLRTVNEVGEADDNPLTTGGIRWLIFKNEDNFESVLIRVGGRIYLDIEKFNQWLEERRGGK